MRIDGEPHNLFGISAAADVVNVRDELSKCQRLLPVPGLHDMSIRRETARARLSANQDPGAATA